MKNLSLSIFTLFCFASCGTTEHILFYNFDVSKSEVEGAILSVINKDSDYVVPSKWTGFNKADYLEMIYVYFKTSPEEVYRIGFKYDKATWDQSSTSTLALVSQFIGDMWRNESDLSNKEIERIEKRFEDEILSKISFRYEKSY